MPCPHQSTMPSFLSKVSNIVLFDFSQSKYRGIDYFDLRNSSVAVLKACLLHLRGVMGGQGGGGGVGMGVGVLSDLKEFSRSCLIISKLPGLIAHSVLPSI